MPEIGELCKGKDLGFVNNNYKIWAVCEICRVARWTCAIRGKADHARCLKCRGIGISHRRYNDEERKQRANQHGRIFRDKQKLLVFQHYSNSEKPCCKICETDDIDILTIDHINNDGHKHRELVGTKMYYWLKRNNFPEGFQILCANCNLKKEILRKRNGHNN